MFSVTEHVGSARTVVTQKSCRWTPRLGIGLSSPSLRKYSVNRACAWCLIWFTFDWCLAIKNLAKTVVLRNILCHIVLSTVFSWVPLCVFTPPNPLFPTKCHCPPHVRATTYNQTFPNPLAQNATVPQTHTIVFKTMTIRAWKNESVCVRNFTEKTDQSPHVRNAYTLLAHSWNNQKRTHHCQFTTTNCAKMPNWQKPFCDNTKLFHGLTRKFKKKHDRMARGTTGPNVLACLQFINHLSCDIHTWTKFLVDSCNAVVSSAFLLRRVWTVKSYNIPLSNLQKPFWKFSQPQSSIIISHVSIGSISARRKWLCQPRESDIP